MTKLRILQYPDPRLKTVARKVETVDARIKKIIDDMFETHYSTDNCAALAATQLDIEDPPAITVIDFSLQKNHPLCLVNPEIIEREGETSQEEGCMSVPGNIFEKIKRAAKIKVRALNSKGEPIEFTADGFMAKCIQHEIDHLNATIFIDHLSRLKRKRIDTRLAKLRRIEKKDKNN